jgi:glycosyltransferase involved in cell wall biosynthesis
MTVPEAAEVVVVDGESDDGTVELSRAAGARVVAQDLEEIRRRGGNFDLARNQVAEHTNRPWLLFLDADERLTPELRNELAAVLDGPPDAVAFDIPRLNLYWGRPVRALGEDLQRRLVRRGMGRFRGASLHQPMEVSGPTGRLNHPIVHLNVRSWRDVVARFRERVQIEAAGQRDRCSLAELVRGTWSLFRYYYLTNRAVLDGARGLAVSLIYAAEHGAVLWQRRRAGRA